MASGEQPSDDDMSTAEQRASVTIMKEVARSSVKRKAETSSDVLTGYDESLTAQQCASGEPISVASDIWKPLCSLSKNTRMEYPRVAKNSLDDSLTAEQRARSQVNRAAAVIRKDAFNRSILAKKNPHLLDERISFIEDSHTYILDGDQKFPMSVSGVWSLFFDQFEPSKTIDRYYDGWAINKHSKYHSFISEQMAFGKADEEIKLEISASWARAGEEASAAGTRMHKQIELFLNSGEMENWDSPEMQQTRRLIS